MKKAKRATRSRSVRREPATGGMGIAWALVVLVIAGAIGWYAYRSDIAGAGAFPIDNGNKIAFQLIGGNSRTLSTVRTASSLVDAFNAAIAGEYSGFVLAVQDGSTLTTTETRKSYDFSNSTIKTFQMIGLTASEMSDFVANNSLPKSANIRGTQAKLYSDSRFSTLKVTMPAGSVTNINRINFQDLNLELNAKHGSQIYVERNAFSRLLTSNYQEDFTVTRLRVASLDSQTANSYTANNYVVVRDNWFEVAPGSGTTQYRVGAKIEPTSSDAVMVSDNQFYVPATPKEVDYRYISLWVTGSQKTLQGINIFRNKFWADVRLPGQNLRNVGIQVNSVKTPEKALVIQGNIFANKYGYYSNSQTETKKNTIVIGNSKMGQSDNVYYDPSNSNVIKDKL